MPRSSPITRCAVLSALALILPLMVALGAASGAATAPAAAVAASTASADTALGRVRGQVTDTAGRGLSRMQVIWFNSSGKYLGKRNANSQGVFGVGPLAPGRYLFQFVDRRPQYDSRKRPQRDISVTVRSNRTTQVRAKMPRGAMLYGTALAGGKRASSARVVAANQWGTSFEVKANRRGEFAIAGLPPGNYSVFTWDARKQWAGRSTYVRAVKANTTRKVSIRLTTRAGGLSVDLYPMVAFRKSRVVVTVTNRQTGQWYRTRVSNGMANLSGLMPGHYRISVPGAGAYLARSGNLSQTVRAGRARFSSFALTKRGGWVTGTAVDPVEGHRLPGVVIALFDVRGVQLATARTNRWGNFRVGGAVPTQNMLRVVMRPAYDWITCPDPDRGSVKYRPRAVTVPRVVAGRGTSLGQVRMSRHKDSATKVCAPPAPTAETETEPAK